MKRKVKRSVASFLAVLCTVISIPMLPLNVKAEKVSGKDSVVIDHDYYRYIEQYGTFSPACENLLIQDEELVTLQSGVSKTYRFVVPENARYNLRISYRSSVGSVLDTEIGIKVDDNYPFPSASNMVLPRMWQDATAIREDDLGNQFSPEQVAYEGFVTKALYDQTGVVIHPYEFALAAGEHTITLEINAGEIEIAEVILAVPDDAKITYKSLSAIYEKEGYTKYEGTPLVVEGEDANIKSNNSIISLSDSTSKQLTPASATKSLINYIGATNWQSSNEEICWTIDVPEDGLYKLGMMYKQDQIIDGLSYRHLRIDGYTPFKEAANIAFPYHVNWEFFEFADEDGDAYYFYLTKGEHQLSLTVTLGYTAEFYSRMKEVAEKLGDLYIDIVMITGESPDVNRDYELFKQIPDFTDTLTECHNELTALVGDIQTLTGERGSSYIAAIQNMDRVLKMMLDSLYTSHQYVKNYYSNYVTLSSWLYEMTVMPLSIDQIRLAAPDGDFEEKKVSFFEKIAFSLQRFIASFSDEYNAVSSEEKEEAALTIWVNWGRDQAQVLNSLIEESFTAETGISVNLEIVNADLVKGLLADNYPDLSLHMARSTPVNLAMRGALCDLTQFEDYEEVITQFGKSSSEPYKYLDGVYALPDQQSFYLMFYRTDIFEELGLEVPNTWEEFMATTAVLQRNNMTSYLPYTQITAANTTDTGVGGLNLYATILMQNGGQFYNEERNSSLLDTVTALDSFRTWTDMYTQYKIPTTQDFYNRFRVGTCPLGIITYTEYMKFQQAAPEIQGRWAIALVPGTTQEDGTIDRSTSGAGTGCSILEKSAHKEEAWEFLKWWTSAETQTRYNANVESILGAISRTTTANVEAFADMGWDESDLQILLAQREQIQEIPEIPGSYYLTRSVDQAFWSVINGEASVKDSLDKWAREANNEIERKVSEYQGGE